MKKIWIVVLVVLLAVFSFAMAQEIHWADQKTVTWDAPVTLIDGSPIPPEDVLAYNMYMRHEDGTEVFIETTPTMPYTYTVPEGVHHVGVSAVRYIGGAGAPFESEVLWSDFLLGYGRPPAVPENIRIAE